MITKAALLLFRDSNNVAQLMFVRTDKPYLVLPGGKQEAGESIEQSLQREIQEELSCDIDTVDHLCTFTGQTPDGEVLNMHLYTADLLGEPKPSSEVNEIVWLSKEGILRRKDEMTPMTLDQILPFCGTQKLW